MKIHRLTLIFMTLFQLLGSNIFTVVSLGNIAAWAPAPRVNANRRELDNIVHGGVDGGGDEDVGRKDRDSSKYLWLGLTWN